jgi:hypothetical protein
MRAMIAFLLLFHPFIGPKLSPTRDGTQYHLPPHGKRKILNELTGEIDALMTSFYFFLHHTKSDWATFTVDKYFIREASLTFNILHINIVKRR